MRALDDELKELCSAFHAPSRVCCMNWALNRDRHIRELCNAQQKSVAKILTDMLMIKRASSSYLGLIENIARPSSLKVAVRGGPEGLLVAARLANKPFKLLLRALAASLNIPSGRLRFGRVKTIVGISRKLESKENDEGKQPDIFDLNRATIVFETETELRAILGALPTYFEIVCLKNKFVIKGQCTVEQPPCLHLNLRLTRDKLPSALLELMEVDQGWVVELQLSTQDFLDVKERCHPIYEIRRLEVPGDNASPLPTNKCRVWRSCKPKQDTKKAVASASSLSSVRPASALCQ